MKARLRLRLNNSDREDLIRAWYLGAAAAKDELWARRGMPFNEVENDEYIGEDEVCTWIG